MQESSGGAAEQAHVRGPFELPVAEDQIPRRLANDLAALVVIDDELGALDAALRRLDDGTYWTCQACGDGIDEPVLAESPLRRRCARCTPPPAADAPLATEDAPPGRPA